MKIKILASLFLCLILYNCSEDDEVYRDEEYRNIELETKADFTFNINNNQDIKTVVGVNDIPLNSNNYSQKYYYLNFLEGITRSSLWMSETPLKPTGTNNGGNTISISFNNDLRISNESDKTYILDSTNELDDLSVNQFFLGSEFNVLNLKDESNAYGYYTPENGSNLTLTIEVFKNSNKINVFLKGGKITDNNRNHHSYLIENYFNNENIDLNDILTIDLALLNIENFFLKNKK